MAENNQIDAAPVRLIVIGGHTRNIGKTQLVCDVLCAFPQRNWIAGKITQYGHGVCARNGEHCGCAPDEHSAAFDWETRADTGTDTSRFLAAGARRSFWLRTKQGFLAEGLPLLRDALKHYLHEPGEEQSTLVVESNSLMQFVKPSLYFAVLDPSQEDFKESALAVLDRAQALVFRGSFDGEGSPAPLWAKFPARLLREKPSVYQRAGEVLPDPLGVLIRRVLDAPPQIFL